MKFCFKCGQQLNGNEKFCPKCGQKLNLPQQAEPTKIEPAQTASVQVEPEEIAPAQTTPVQAEPEQHRAKQRDCSRHGIIFTDLKALSSFMRCNHDDLRTLFEKYAEFMAD